MENTITNLKFEKEQVVEKEQQIRFKDAIVKLSYLGLLNIRKSPSKLAEVICKVSNNTHLKIDPIFNNDIFVKVITNDGVKGYCMKDFIKFR